MSIWSVKETDRVLFGVVSVLVFFIGAWDLVSGKSWSSLYFSEDVVILGAWSVTIAYFTIGAIDIMGMFVGTMTEYVAEMVQKQGSRKCARRDAGTGSRGNPGTGSRGSPSGTSQGRAGQDR